MSAIPRGKIKRLALTIVLIGTCIYGVGATLDLLKVKKMTATKKTVCVGRILIEVPATVEVSYGQAMISGWHIESKEETIEQFQNALLQKEKLLESQLNERGRPSLEMSRSVETNDVVGKIFSYNRRWNYWFEAGRRIDSTVATAEALFHIGGRSYTIRAESGADRLDALRHIISKIKPRDHVNIPAAPGFCIEDAMIMDPPLPAQTESAVAFFSFPQHPDFGVAMDVAGGLKPSPPLLSRVGGNDIDLASKSIVLRRSDRTVNGFDGQEFVEKFYELNGVSTHNFHWESASDPQDLLKPELSFELSTGIAVRPGAKPVNSSLSDIALFELWDSLLNSIRLRPTAQTADKGRP